MHNNETTAHGTHHQQQKYNTHINPFQTKCSEIKYIFCSLNVFYLPICRMCTMYVYAEFVDRAHIYYFSFTYYVQHCNAFFKSLVYRTNQFFIITFTYFDLNTLRFFFFLTILTFPYDQLRIDIKKK